MPEGTQYNVVGARGRDCPLCFKPAALEGGGLPGRKLTCRFCWFSFRFEPPHTLVQVATVFEAPKRCACGVIIGAFIDRCQVCIAEEAKQVQLARAA
jgi:hypothetical protein